MKKKTLQKVLSALLCLTMMSTVVGCGNSEEVKESSSTQTEKTTEKESSVEKEEVEEPQETVELSYFWGNPDNNPDGLPWLEEWFIENTGATYRFREGDTSVLQTMMASGELCDITVIQNEQLMHQAIDGDMIVNLNDYKDQMPNIFENELFAAYIKRQEDLFGGVYGLPVNLGAQSKFYIEPKLLWNVYEQIGSPEINTFDDLLTVMKDMMDACPTNAEGEKTYGTGLFAEWEGGKGLPAFVKEQCYNLRGVYDLYEVGTVSSILSEDPEYNYEDGSMLHQALQFYFKANQMGILDPDSAVHTYSSAGAMAQSGRYMCYVYGGNVNAEEGIGYRAVLEPAFTLTARPSQTFGGGWFLTAANNENTDTTIKFLDFIYSYEAQTMMANGPEGILYEFNDAGERVMTAEYEAARESLGSTGEARKAVAPEEDYLTQQSYVANMFDLIMPDQVDPATGAPLGIDKQYPLKSQSALDQAWYKHYGEYTMAEYTKMDKAGNATVIVRNCALTMMPTVPEELDEILQTVRPTMNELSYKMIFAKDEAEFNAYWEQLKSDCETVGLKEVYDWAVNALEETKAKYVEYTK